MTPSSSGTAWTEPIAPAAVRDREPSADRLGWIPPLVAAGIVVLSALATAMVAQHAIAKAHERFARAAAVTRSEIEHRIASYLTSLWGLSGLFASNERMRRRDFRRALRHFELQERLPGIIAIGWSPRTAADERQALVETARKDGIRRFRIRPEGDRSEYFPVLYLEPLDRHRRRLLGRDLAADPVLAATLERARDRGRPMASAAVARTEPDGRGPRSHLFVCVPVYGGDEILRSVSARQARLVGIVHAEIDAEVLFRTVRTSGDDLAPDLDVYDGAQPDPARLLYTSTPGTALRGAGRFGRTTRITVGGRTWTLVLRSPPRFDASVISAAPPMLLATGLATALLVFVFMRSQIDARLRAERATSALRRSEEALRSANRAKDDFLAALSHELRTPLGNVLMWTQLLRVRGGDPQVSVRAVATIERNARQLSRLIDDLLDVSRIASGKLSLALRPTELANVVRSALEEAQPAAEAKRLAVDFDDGQGAYWVSGDPTRLLQVVANLLSNAIKFTPDGGRIALRLEEARGMARLTVSDSGIGIAAAALPQIFERFRQEATGNPSAHGGLGLGLAIVRHIVERHGGRVRVASEGVGRGACFTVEIPLLGSGEAAARSGASSAGVSAGGRPLEGITALVVEDQADARDAVAIVLASAGARVTTVDNSIQALATLERDPPDILLSDVALPGRDGYDLIRRVRALAPAPAGKIPAVAVTAYATPEDRRRALEAGFHVHLAKPLEAAQLVATVAGLVAVHAPRPVHQR